MRMVAKRAYGGYHLARQNGNQPATAAEAKSRWGRFDKKPEVLALLLEEQYRLCCYSEVRADLIGLGYHIDHVQPKSDYPQRTFDYENMGASALSSEDLNTFKIHKDELFGGHARLREYDSVHFVTCHEPGCHRFFAYLSDGRVVPSHHLGARDKDRATYTIDVLNLNSPYLVAQRRQWWGELEEHFDRHVIKGWSIEDLVAVCLVPTAGALSQFFSLTRQFFGAVAEAVLLQEAPELV